MVSSSPSIDAIVDEERTESPRCLDFPGGKGEATTVGGASRGSSSRPSVGDTVASPGPFTGLPGAVSGETSSQKDGCDGWAVIQGLKKEVLIYKSCSDFTLNVE